MAGEIGKVPYKELARILGLKPSLDASPLENMLAATNPAIGLPGEELGFFAYHYSASNLAVSFAEPRYMLVDAVFPPGYPLDDITGILGDLWEEASRYGTRIVGGHTARYKGLALPLIATTALGPQVRPRKNPAPGDHVFLIGRAGLEAAKLLGNKVPLEELTPLPKALSMFPLEEVKFMHDVSEGGIAGSLIEVAEATGRAIRLSRLPEPPPGLPRDVDILSAPSYGTLLVFSGDRDICGKTRYACMELGVVEKGPPRLLVDGEELQNPPPNPLWELYGEEVAEDPALARVHAAALAIASTPGVEKLVPEVGMNLAYAPSPPRGVGGVAAIDGRIVRTTTGARVCGEPRYGASKHLAEVIVAAAEAGLPWRAAINTRVDGAILSAAALLGLSPVRVEARDACPIAAAVRAGVNSRALWYGPAPGLEPSLVILGKSPEELVTLIKGLARRLG